MSTGRGLLLGVGGLVIEAVYLVASLLLPWWRHGGGLISWRRALSGAAGGQMPALLACLAAIGVLALAYVGGWRVVRRRAVPRRLIWGGSILFTATLFWLQPITADLFVYVSQAHLFTDLGANPFLVAPSAFAGDPLLSAYATRYTARPSVYGPAWVLLTLPGTWGPHDVAVGLLWMKSLAAGAFLGCAWLVERILRRTNPAVAPEGLYLLAWNPLVLLMAVGDGHNDIVMMAIVLLALWWLLQERWAPAAGALVLSVWVKWTSLLFLPFCLLYAWAALRGVRAGARAKGRPGSVLAQAGLAGLAVSAVILAPFGRPDWIGGIVERFLWPVNWAAATPGLTTAAVAAGACALAGACVVLARRLMRRGASFPELADTAFLVAFLAFLLGAPRTQPWHLVWPATLAGLCRRRWAWPVIIGLSTAMLVAQVWIEWGTPGL